MGESGEEGSANGNGNGSRSRDGRESQVVFKDPKAFEEKKQLVVTQGAENVQIITDFDFTMTRFWVDGKRGASCHMVISSSGLLTEEYHKHTEELREQYYPMEVDVSLSTEIKEKAMAEWVTKAHEAMAEAGMTKSKLATAVSTASLELRPGHGKLFHWVESQGVPMLLFSAGISDVLEEVIKQRSEAPLPSTCEVVSNKMTFDEKGNVTGFEGELFHVLNKHASAVLDRPYFQSENVKRRSNVILIGDSLGDLNMAKGINAKEVLSIGFLNDKVEERLEAYKEAYDAVILGDEGFEFLLGILDELAKQ